MKQTDDLGQIILQHNTDQEEYIPWDVLGINI